MSWIVDYHQRESYQPSVFTYSNIGPKWTFHWLSYIQDNPNNTFANADLYLKGGGVRTFTGYNNNTKSYAPELQSNDVLVRICPACYEVRHPDGSKEVYGRPDGGAVGRRIFLTSIINATGDSLTLSYDDRLRLVALKDALGQVTNISYENASDIYKITKVTDPFGRFATFEYDGQGRLAKIKDMIGMVSSFHYLGSDFIDQMTTPYGITTFIKEDGPGRKRALETHYPLGEKERVEFVEQGRGIPYNETIVPGQMPVFNQYINYRTTYFWDKKAMQEAPGDYTKARIYHWLHGSPQTGESDVTAPLLESIKEPLENRVWYDYQGQDRAGFTNQGMSARPYIVGRVMEDGTTQLSSFTYNSLGKTTSTVDPLGRKFTYIYDSTNINLLEIRQTTGTSNELLAQYTYNKQFLPLTAKDASGQLTRFTYNTSGQLLTTQNPKKETTTLAYDDKGYFKSATGPVSGTTVNFTYDGFGRVRTVTDTQGFTVTTDYDSLDRPTVITYPDSSYEQIVYDRLDAVHMKDRLGRWSHITYDSLDRPVVTQDALGRKTQFKWCNCGSLSQIINALNHSTSFTFDLQGRLIAKVYNDGKTIGYKYEKTTSRLIEATDARGQKTQYSYFNDGNLKQVSHTNAAIATPSVSFTYDTRYNRVLSMKDTTGTTLYSYNPVAALPVLGAGRLAIIDGPLANDLITYNYDSLGSVNGRSINNVSSSVTFDSLDRVTSVTNPLGNFTYHYVQQTNRLLSVNLPNGLSSVFDYFDTKGDQRLKQIWNKSLYGNTQSKFDYGYNLEGQITSWTQQASGIPPKALELGYDAADQLISVSEKASQLPIVIQQFAYRYDSAGNKLMEQTNKNATFSAYNSLNQLIKQWKADTIRQVGSLPLTASNTGNNSLSYDDNGNMISSTFPAVTYGWDAANRLVKIIQGSNITEFVYDGLSRRVAEKQNGTIIKRWLWDGMEMAEERDGLGGTVTKRFFAQGEQINGINYYYAFDHLGSVREMTDVKGVVKVRYDYDPYGRRTKVFGDIDADFGFTGYYYHSLSKLNLAFYRSYDANIGRWLNRDPLGEKVGINLYTYVNGNSINLIDPLGLVDAPGFGGSSGPSCGEEECDKENEDWDLNKDGKLQKNEADNWWVKGGGKGVSVNNANINWSGLKIPKGTSIGSIFAISTTDAFLILPYETAATYGGTSFRMISATEVSVFDQSYHYNYRKGYSAENVTRNFMTWCGKPIGQGTDFMIHYYNPIIQIK